MHWSPSGDNLAIKIVRYAKKKGKNLSYQISMIRLAEKNAPIDVCDNDDINNNNNNNNNN